MVRRPDPHLSCWVCGARFRNMLAEAKHRHNFPAMCKRTAQFKRWEAEQAKATMTKDKTDE